MISSLPEILWLVRNRLVKSCSLKLYLHLFSSCHTVGVGLGGAQCMKMCSSEYYRTNAYQVNSPKKIYFNFLPSRYKPGWLAAFHDHDILRMMLTLTIFWACFIHTENEGRKEISREVHQVCYVRKWLFEND